MFSNIKISRRLILLISALTLIFVITGAVGLSAMRDLSRDVEILNESTAESALFARIASGVRYHLLDVGQQLASGALDWQQATQLLRTGAREFDIQWLEHQTRIAGRRQAHSPENR